MTRLPLVSVIIPCYNQSRFLGEAIQSALNQNYAAREIIVVDDGSTDDCAQIAARYSEIKLIRQNNRGLSAARNAGLAASVGEYLVFLDADDRLLPDALKVGVNSFLDHNYCGFIYGRYSLIDSDGVRISASPRHGANLDSYVDLLRFNYIGMHATVMYCRSVLKAAGGFDTSLRACEDYDLFLRITRRFPIHYHGELLAEYRQHDSNMSASPALMLESSVRVLRSQRRNVRGNERARQAYKTGIRNWQEYYGNRLIKSLRLHAKAREWKRLIREALVLIQYNPRGLTSRLFKKIARIAQEGIPIVSSGRNVIVRPVRISEHLPPSQGKIHEPRYIRRNRHL